MAGFIEDLTDCVEFFIELMYVVHIKVILTILSCIELHKDLDALAKYCVHKKMELNIIKYTCISFTGKLSSI